MRILHLIANLLSGGAQQQLSYLIGEQRRLGYDTHVGYLHPGPKLPLFERTGADLHQFAARGNHEPSLFLETNRLIRRLKADVVQTWLLQMDVVGGLCSRTSGKAWVMTERASAAHYDKGLKPAARVLIGRRADAIVSNSEAGNAYWAERVGPAVLRRVIRNAVPTGDIRAAPPRAKGAGGFPEGRSVVLYAGRFSPQKNMEALVPALGALARRFPMTAYLCGDGTHEEEARALIARLKLEDVVRFVGYVDDVWSWMKTADVFVSVSHFEGHPNTVLEAAACGCPLVLSDIPEHREMLKDSEALFVDRTSSASISDALERVLREPVEAKRRAEAACDAVASLSVAAMARSYDGVYGEVVERRRAKGRR